MQGETGAVRGRGGLGIGLAVVQRLTELHGGTIVAASDGPGRGSTFTLRLRSVAAPGARVAPPWPAATPGPCQRVLIAEADPDLRAVLRSVLQASGHDVSEAEDGPGAFETAVQARPDVMLIDVELPGFDGYDLARRLRMTPETKATLLVALGGPDDVDHARMVGFDRHAVKPVDPSTLADVVLP